MFGEHRATHELQRPSAQSWACLAERRSDDFANRSCNPMPPRCIQRFAFATTRPATRAFLSRSHGFLACDSWTNTRGQTEQFPSHSFVLAQGPEGADSRANV